MSVYLLLRFLHIASALAFVGGLFARQLVRGLADQSADVRTFADLSRAAGRIENVLVIPGNLAVIVVGILLSLVTRAPMLGFLQGASQNWLLASLVLLVLGMAAVPLVFVPRGKLFDVELQRALQQGAITPALRTMLHDPLVRATHVAELVLVIVVLWLMVAKPF